MNKRRSFDFTNLFNHAKKSFNKSQLEGNRRIDLKANFEMLIIPEIDSETCNEAICHKINNGKSMRRGKLTTWIEQQCL